MSRPFFLTVQLQGVMVLGAGHCCAPCGYAGRAQSTTQQTSSQRGTIMDYLRGRTFFYYISIIKSNGRHHEHHQSKPPPKTELYTCQFRPVWRCFFLVTLETSYNWIQVPCKCGSGIIDTIMSDSFSLSIMISNRRRPVSSRPHVIHCRSKKITLTLHAFLISSSISQVHDEQKNLYFPLLRLTRGIKIDR